jgi:hypothetical protein
VLCIKHCFGNKMEDTDTRAVSTYNIVLTRNVNTESYLENLNARDRNAGAAAKMY